jgi:uncharacterized protein (TIGR02453 family)
LARAIIGIMRHFTPALFDFLRDLNANNDRDWFAANRDRYTADVEEPFLAFIRDFAPKLREISAAYVADPRRMGGSMFRVHRDTRFSPDKSPFKTWMAARFAHEARRKVPSVPAFYLHLGLDHSLGGGGAYHVERPALTRIRQRMVELPSEWATAKTGLEILGDQLKRAPAGFPASHEHIEDLKRQNIYVMTEFTQDEVVGDGFLERFTSVCERVAPVIEFQTKALGLRW